MKIGYLMHLTFCLAFLLVGNSSRAQTAFSLTGGYGSPEQANLGVRMRVDQNQFGLNVGTNPGYKNDNFCVSGEYYYHFGGRSGHTSLQPWFIKTGITYMTNEGEWEKRTNLLLVPRLGREFNVTSEFGVALEAGIMIMLLDENLSKKERTDYVSGDLDLIGSGFILPSVGFRFFYRL